MPTEKEFLSSYDIHTFERPSLTTDVAAFTVRSEDPDNYKRDSDHKLSVLLVHRAEHPFRDCWALPGGFLRPEETVEECALREIMEESNVAPSSLLPIGLFSDPGRDPRGWIISAAFASVISEDAVKKAGGDVSDAQWFDVTLERDERERWRLVLTGAGTRLTAVLKSRETRFGRTSFGVLDSGSLAFDHAGIIASALTVIREKAKDIDTVFDFLPERFTLTELQKVQETVMDITMLPANFRRKISEYVEETEESTQGAGHRPAKLYRRKTEH